MRKLWIRPRARLDILEIRNYIAQDNLPAADRVAGAIAEAIESIVEMPGKGHQRADVKDIRFRFWAVYSYMIAYRYDDDAVTIVRVVHGNRNFRSVFRGRIA